MIKKETRMQYMRRMRKVEESTQVFINDDTSIRRSFYDDGGKEINVIEIGNFDRFEICLVKQEAEKLIEALQKLVKEL